MKEVNILTRKDGSQVKIVAALFTGRGLALSIGNDVFHRKDVNCQWRLCGDRPTHVVPWSVDGYIKHGRPEMFRVASHGEILKTNSVLMSRVRMEANPS
ncbi:MAG: hypothetical protein Q7S87_10220 [Agitococcus sp.]|nr:hypothetical protein [Agitococcus sp.]MDO9179297.1 hypothetical protein [Agitococcus sp.]